MTTWRVEIDWLGRPMLANHELSMHWAKKMRLHDKWRAAGAQAAMVHKLPKGMPRCKVTATARYRRGTLPDAAGIAPSVKCLLDGMVDFGCWPDDDQEWIASERYVPATRDPSRPDAVILTLRAVA